MKRCALIISDNVQYRRWLGYQITAKWPKMLIEHCRMSRASAYLDMSEIGRYQMIFVRLSWQPSDNFHTCLMILRILALETRPEIIIIANTRDDLDLLKSTNLIQTTHLLATSLTSRRLRTLLDDIYARSGHQTKGLREGAPDISGYRIHDPIAGTYGATIYQAYSEHLGFDVALKIRDISASHCSTDDNLALLNEFRVLRRLGGDYICRAFDYGETGPIAYMAMEYLPHGDIGQYLATAGRRTDRIQFMLRVAEGIREIHNAGYLHLDIKPNNVMVRADGTPVLIDFGICKRIVRARMEDRRSRSLGSPYYMSPEQICGDAIDVRSDLYSFGALWYRVFTGHVPFSGRHFDASKIYECRKHIPSLGQALQRFQPIIDRTLAADRAMRLATAQELIDMIKYCSGQQQQHYKCHSRIVA